MLWKWQHATNARGMLWMDTVRHGHGMLWTQYAMSAVRSLTIWTQYVVGTVRYERSTVVDAVRHGRSSTPWTRFIYYGRTMPS